jgi:transcriptional regulator of met regulon
MLMTFCEAFPETLTGRKLPDLAQVMKDVKEDDKCVCNATASNDKVESGGGQKVLR